MVSDSAGKISGNTALDCEPSLSSHAVQRWIARVNPGASEYLARKELVGFLRLARTSKRPPKWARARGREGTTTFATAPDRPGVLVAMQGIVAVTVITREEVRRRSQVTRRMGTAKDNQ